VRVCNFSILVCIDLAEASIYIIVRKSGIFPDFFVTSLDETLW
jgi:hypothetical protein